ncbi:hypothetical protein CMK11_00175 [Candidatus Poribacteria bacterium]|nr:hypothetical protein [Candidatus Poribacteria bacterium]
MGSYDRQTDATLVQLTLRGERRAYDALVARHRRLLYAVAYAELLDDGEADDVVQDAFMRAYERLEQLRAPDRLRSWLCRIAASCARARNRAATRGSAAMARMDDGPTTVTPDTSHLDREELARRALRAAPPDCRRVLLMRFGSDTTFKEIGEVLLITGDAAEKRLRRGLRAMRAYLRRAGLEEDCRDVLRTHCLTLAALAHSATPTPTQSTRPGVDTRVTRAGGASGWAWAAVGCGGAALLLLGSVLVGASARRGSMANRDGSGHAVEYLTTVLHRPVALLRNDTPILRQRELLRHRDALEGWLPADPARDSRLPRPAGNDLPGHRDAIAIMNGYGVYRPLPDTADVVVVDAWMQTPATDGLTTVGFVFGDTLAEWERLLRRAGTRPWQYRTGYDEPEATGRVTACVHMRIVYRPAAASYDVSLDGDLVVKDAYLATTFVGRPVRGFFIRSGDGVSEAVTYVDDIRIAALPSAGDARGAPRGAGRGVEPLPDTSRIRLVGGRLNGRDLLRPHATVTVAPGAPIRGWVSVRLANSHGPHAEYPVVQAATWQPGAAGYRTVARHARAGVGEYRTEIDLIAPEQQGAHHIVIAGAAETTPAHVASGTNWAGGEPV